MDWNKVYNLISQLLNGNKDVETKPTNSSGNSPEVLEAAKQVTSDMIDIPDDEFKAELDEHMKESSRVLDSECVSEPECTPDTCWGECQGMGWCDTATEFRNAIIPKINNKPHAIGCRCKKCTEGNHLIFR